MCTYIVAEPSSREKDTDFRFDIDRAAHSRDARLQSQNESYSLTTERGHVLGAGRREEWEELRLVLPVDRLAGRRRGVGVSVSNTPIARTEDHGGASCSELGEAVA